jgi:hypothetical protein
MARIDTAPYCGSPGSVWKSFLLKLQTKSTRSASMKPIAKAIAGPRVLPGGGGHV